MKNKKLLEDSGDQPHSPSITTTTVYKIVEEFSAQEEISDENQKSIGEYDLLSDKTEYDGHGKPIHTKIVKTTIIEEKSVQIENEPGLLITSQVLSNTIHKTNGDQIEILEPNNGKQ